MGKPYELTKAAENDLREVARYTRERWGLDALNVYRAGLNKTFLSLMTNSVASRYFSSAFPALKVAKYKYHYIFFVTDSGSTPIIIGVIHEKRDILSHLSGRLS